MAARSKPSELLVAEQGHVEVVPTWFTIPNHLLLYVQA